MKEKWNHFQMAMRILFQFKTICPRRNLNKRLDRVSLKGLGLISEKIECRSDTRT